MMAQTFGKIFSGLMEKETDLKSIEMLWLNPKKAVHSQGTLQCSLKYIPHFLTPRYEKHLKQKLFKCTMTPLPLFGLIAQIDHVKATIGFYFVLSFMDATCCTIRACNIMNQQYFFIKGSVVAGSTTLSGNIVT